MVDIRKITAVDTYGLRHRFLRPHQSIEQCQFEGDTDLDTAHFAAYRSDELVGILSVYHARHEAIPEPNGWQLRAIVTDKRVRGKGYGGKLIARAESYVIGQGGQYIWANARLHAVGFYEKLGYVRVGEMFHIPDVGPHILVCKRLGRRDANSL